MKHEKHKTKNAVNFTAPSILFQLNLPDNFTALYRPPWFCVWGASKWWGGTNFEHLGRIESTFLKNVFPFSKVLRFQQFSMICCDLGLVYFFQSQIFLCLIKIKNRKPNNYMLQTCACVFGSPAKTSALLVPTKVCYFENQHCRQRPYCV